MSLDSIKQRLSRKYLGKAGIHGIGVSKMANAVRVHIGAPKDPEEETRQNTIVEQVKQDAAPYEVLVTVEEMSKKSG
jgi:hypothetical protein